MRPKPRGLERQYAEQFCDPSVVSAYGTRPPYPNALVALVLDLAGGASSRLLDLGCGTGELTRRLAPHVESITAIDQSEPMVQHARTLPGGDAANIDWIVGRVEDADLNGPFSCGLAAESLHWFDWASVWPRLEAWLPASRLVLVERRERQNPWSGELVRLIGEYSTNRDFERYDLLDELVARECFRAEGSTVLGPEPFQQSVDDYVTSIHSRNGFSRDRMTPDSAIRFDAAVTRLVTPYSRQGVLELSVESWAAWGRAL